jgi:hypothetical protein
MIEGGSTVTRNPNVVARDLTEGEGAVLLHLDSGQYHSINPVGQAIWELLDGQRTVDEVTAQLRRLVDDPPESLEADVRQFLQDVEDRNLVTVA